MSKKDIANQDYLAAKTIMMQMERRQVRVDWDFLAV